MNLAAANEPDMTRDEQAGLWCARLASGTLSLDDQRVFDKWVESDDANREALNKALAVWHGLQEVGGAPELITMRADALEAMRRANRRRWSRSIFSGWKLPIAAVASLALIFISLALLHDPVDVYRTGIGERRTVLLDDGSRLSLDAATTVQVDYERKRRSLLLIAGRAKFNVAKDTNRPFVVSAGGKEVVATGTMFSVELVGRQMRVILYEGRVKVLDRPATAEELQGSRVSPARSSSIQPLSPGRELIAALDRPATQIINTDVARSLSWEGGQMNFADEPLADAVERLNRYTTDKIIIRDSRTGGILINGVFNAGDSAAFVDAVASAYPVRVSRENGQTILSAR